jgi:hypothetical protein
MSQKGPLNSAGGGGTGNIMTLSSEGGPHTPPVANNFNFSGSIAGGSAANGAIEFITPGGPGAATDGQMDAVVLTDNVTIHINASNELEATGAVGQFIEGDTGGPLPPAAGVWQILAHPNSGSTVFTAGSGSTLNLKVSDNQSNTIIGSLTGIGTNSCTGLGTAVFNHLTTGTDNTAVGKGILGLADNTSFCTGIGSGALGTVLSSTYLIGVGYLSGNAYNSTESNNICIDSSGVLGESTVIRIGDLPASGTAYTQCFLGGIVGAAPSGSPVPLMVDSVTGQLTPGSGGGSGITTINGDTGSATGSTVTFDATPTAGSSVSFSASGATVALNVTDSNDNTIIGLNAGNGSISGTNTTGLGFGALQNFGAGNNVTAVGFHALNGLGGNDNCTAVGSNSILAMFGQGNTGIGSSSLGSASGASGAFNTCVGFNAAVNLTSGAENLILGTAGTAGSGSQYTSSESSNILLNNIGVTGESNVMRLGTDGSGGGQVNQAFCAGIIGASSSNPVPLSVDSITGQLTPTVSSRRFKENIQELKTSKIKDLTPVSFNYLGGTSTHYGMIAEDVEKIMPELIAYDGDSKPYSIKYQEMYALLLAEIKSLKVEVELLKTKVAS